jgi:hypothetical protein
MSDYHDHTTNEGGPQSTEDFYISLLLFWLVDYVFLNGIIFKFIIDIAKVLVGGAFGFACIFLGCSS